MTRIHYLILLSLALVVSGCSTPHTNSSVPAPDSPEESVAILPVISTDIIMNADSNKDYVKMAEETNSILTRLVEKSKSEALLGPNQVRELLDKSELQSLYGILNELEDPAGNGQSIRLAKISKRLEAAKIIWLKLEIQRPRGYIEEVGDKGFTWDSKQWCVWITVTAELFRMSPAKLIATQTIQSAYCGETGVACVGADIFSVAVPYDTYPRSEREGLAQTLQEAIAEVMKKPTSNG